MQTREVFRVTYLLKCKLATESCLYSTNFSFAKYESLERVHCVELTFISYTRARARVYVCVHIIIIIISSIIIIISSSSSSSI